jgi:tRNA pseudouridine55 synthase
MTVGQEPVPREAPAPVPDGVLVVDKPMGPTSHDIVALIRRLTGVRRVGHGGTLDPFARGVLPVFIGRATRMVEYHLADDKAYRATVALGATSTTDDLDGELTPVDGPTLDRATVEAALDGFRGTIEQVPPDHSAVHVGGRRAYELARSGDKLELRPRTVTIEHLGLVSWDDSAPDRPVAVLDVRCSAGTYIRSIARDLGTALGSGAYLAALTRTASGPFRVEDAHPLEHVRAELAGGRAVDLLLPPDAGLDSIPRLELEASALDALARGQVVGLGAAVAPAQDALVRVVDGEGRLAAMARVRGRRLFPDKVFVAPGA